jgi:hypothetical protein
LLLVDVVIRYPHWPHIEVYFWNLATSFKIYFSTLYIAKQEEHFVHAPIDVLLGMAKLKKQY